MQILKPIDGRLHEEEITKQLHRGWAELRDAVGAAWAWELGPIPKISISLEELMEDLSHGRD
jgi:hypothetical protein